MVTTKHHGKMTVMSNFFYLLRKDIARTRDLGQVLCMWIFDALLFLSLNSQIAVINNFVAEARELITDTGITDSGRSHIDAASALPQIHRYTNYVYRVHRR